MEYDFVKFLEREFHITTMTPEIRDKIFDKLDDYTLNYLKGIIGNTRYALIRRELLRKHPNSKRCEILKFIYDKIPDWVSSEDITSATGIKNPFIMHISPEFMVFMGAAKIKYTNLKKTSCEISGIANAMESYWPGIREW